MFVFKYARAKSLVDSSGWHRWWIAEAIGLTPKTFTQYLNGHAKPGRETVGKLAKVLKVDLDEIYTERVPKMKTA